MTFRTTSFEGALIRATVRAVGTCTTQVSVDTSSELILTIVVRVLASRAEAPSAKRLLQDTSLHTLVSVWLAEYALHNLSQGKYSSLSVLVVS